MLDRFLPLWIALAMAAGLALGSLIPGLNDALDAMRPFVLKNQDIRHLVARHDVGHIPDRTAGVMRDRGG